MMIIIVTLKSSAGVTFFESFSGRRKEASEEKREQKFKIFENFPGTSFRNLKQYIIFSRLKSSRLLLCYLEHSRNFNKRSSSLFALCFDGRNYVTTRISPRWWFNVYIGKMFKLLRKIFSVSLVAAFFVIRFRKTPLFFVRNSLLRTNGKVS